MTIATPHVCIIVLNWNNAADTLRCIASLERQTYANRSILLVENGSTDDSLQQLRKLGGRVRLVMNGANLGFTGGCNRAMWQAFAEGADYVWLFNNDAEADPEALATLVALCEADGRIGLASPVVREAEDRAKIQFVGGIFDLSLPIHRPGYDLAQAAEWHSVRPDQITLHGTALLVRRRLYERIGGLDDDYFAYWEDIDYSIRSAEAGFRNVTAFDTSIQHGSKPTSGAPETVKPHYYYYVTRNELLMWRKRTPGARFRKAALWILARQLRQIARMPGYRTGIEAVLAGLWDGWRGIGGPWQPVRRMPLPLRWFLGRHPRLVLNLLGTR